MNAQERELYSLLDRYGFGLDRSKKHRVYKNAQGKSLVLPNSPSDDRWAQNALHQLKNLLGIGTRGKEAFVGERREKVIRSCTAEVTAFGVVVRIEQVFIQPPLASFQRSHNPANANNSRSLTSKQYGCLAFPVRTHS
jgi:hypothetical protein